MLNKEVEIVYLKKDVEGIGIELFYCPGATGPSFFILRKPQLFGNELVKFSPKNTLNFPVQKCQHTHQLLSIMWSFLWDWFFQGVPFL